MARVVRFAPVLLSLLLVSCPLGPVLEWVAFRPLQCDNNPWPLLAEGSGPFPVDELGAIVEFFEAQGIDLRSVGLLPPAGDELVCLACSCPRGDLLVARAAPEDALRLVREFDFRYLVTLESRRWLGTAPVQCNGNPWEETLPSDPFAEARAVRRWAAEQGAAVGRAGFVFPVPPQFTCLACSCPRGDGLLVAADSPDDAGILQGLGFGRLFR